MIVEYAFNTLLEMRGAGRRCWMVGMIIFQYSIRDAGAPQQAEVHRRGEADFQYSIRDADEVRRAGAVVRRRATFNTLLEMPWKDVAFYVDSTDTIVFQYSIRDACQSL